MAASSGLCLCVSVSSGLTSSRRKHTNTDLTGCYEMKEVLLSGSVLICAEEKGMRKEVRWSSINVCSLKSSSIVLNSPSATGCAPILSWGNNTSPGVIRFIIFPRIASSEEIPVAWHRSQLDHCNEAAERTGLRPKPISHFPPALLVIC